MILAHDREVFEELCGNLTPEEQQTLNRLTDVLIKDIDSE